MKLIKLLRILEDIEGNLAKLYRLFQVHFEDDTEASQLFGRLARDEVSHKNIVKYQKNLVSKNPDRFKDIEIDYQSVTKTNDMIVELLDKDITYSVEQAVKIALNFEKCAAEQHYRTAVLQSNDELKTVIESLGSSDKAHAERLVEFAGSRNIDVKCG